MTISEAIEICDRLTPNSYADDDKVRWLMTLDQLIYNDVITTHEGADAYIVPYYSTSDMTRKLIAAEPYAEDIYVNYLQAQIGKQNGEDAKYNKAVTFYNDGYERFAKAYNEAHRPLPRFPFFRF